MTEEHTIVGYTFVLQGADGSTLATRQLDKPADVDWDDLDAHLALWQVIYDAHIIRGEKGSTLVTINPHLIATLQITGYVYE
jgi:hypothetical protein